MEDKMLELVSTDDLLKELKNRFDGHIFHGVKKEIRDDHMGEKYTANWNGGIALAFGLCKTLKISLRKKIF